MKKALTFIDKRLEEIILVSGVTVMIIIIFFQVIMRYFFNNSLAWSEELARYLFIWQVWLAVPYTVTKGRHIRLEVLRDLVGSKAKFVLDMIFFLVSALFFGYIAYQSTTVVQGIFKMNQLTPVMQIPKWICYFSVPVGCALSSIRFIQYGIYRYQRFLKNTDDTATFAIEAEE